MKQSSLISLFCLCAAFAPLHCFHAIPAEPSNELPVVLTNLQQIISLKSNELRSARYQAHVRSVIVHVWPATRRIYLQQGKLGLEVALSSSATPFRPGQMVEVNGNVQPALPRPRISAATAKVLSERDLPKPKAASAFSLAAGQDPFRFASLRFIVRDMISHNAGFTLLATHNSSPFEVVIGASPNLPLPEGWIDAELEAHGISIPLYNTRAQLTGFRFHVQATNDIKVVNPGLTNQFDRPLLTIAEASGRPQEWSPRLKVAGTVLAHRSEGAIFLQDDTGVMRVELLPFLPKSSTGYALERDVQNTLQPGERVEVTGVRHNWFSLTPTLIMAEFRRIGRGPLPPSKAVSVEDLQKGLYPGRLVSLKARLVDFRGRSSGWNIWQQMLVLQSGNSVFTARWESESRAQWREWQLTPSAYVQITGVNEADESKQKGRASFQLLLRSPSDVVQIPEPPFWTRPETMRATLAAASVGLVAAAWIFLQRLHLRRLEQRVAERTAELRGEVAARQAAQEELRVALVAEKELNELKGSFVSMVSHEFRTPLEVILSSSNILDRYLERLPLDKRKAQLRSIRKSVTRMTDLIDDVLLLGKFDAAGMACHPIAINLPALCRRAVAEIESAVSRPGAIRMQFEDVGGVAHADEGLLHHILTNLLSNALKYSPPDCPVDLAVTRDGLNGRFVVRDRGRGIPRADQARLFTAFYRGSNVGQTQGSGLGLVIVKRCVDLHAGSISCESAEGAGAVFTVSLPLFDGTRFLRRRDLQIAQKEPPSNPASSIAQEQLQTHDQNSCY